MIIALFSDIHSNREALQACLSDAAAHGAEQHVFLGDIIGYGADPSFVVETIAGLAAKGAIVIKGNHDEAVVSQERDTSNSARIAIEWTKTRLNQSEKAFLQALPFSASLGELLFVHGDASDPASWIYVTGPDEAEYSMRATQQRVTFTGHVHRPLLTKTPLRPASNKPSVFSSVPVSGAAQRLEREFKWHAVLGSVGQPRDGNTASAYALYDDATEMLTYMRVAYDIAKAADKIRAAGLPEKLADRLFLGD